MKIILLKIQYFFLTKLKLSYLRPVVNLLVLNLLLTVALAVMGFMNAKQWKTLQESLKYVKLNSVPMHEVASSDMQDIFDQLTVDAGLTINNKNAQYAPFEEKRNVIKAQYDMALEGKYLAFVNYLEMLYGKNMLYKINTLVLKVKPDNTLHIKINLESLYEVE